MTSELDPERDDALADLDPDLLARWEAPAPAEDLTCRIMARLNESPAPIVPLAAPAEAGNRRLWLALGAVGVLAAASLALVLASTWRRAAPPPAAPPAAAVSAPAAVAPAPGPGPRLLVRTVPRDAIVTVDDQPVRGPSPFVVAELSPGSHRVRIEREGYLPVTRTVDGSGGDVELPVELGRRDVVLALHTDPPEAALRLWVDDEPQPLEPGTARHALSRDPGSFYELEASAPGYQSRRIPLPLTGAPDQEVRLTLVPDPDAPPPEFAESMVRGSSSGRRGSPDLKDPFSSRRRTGSADDSADDETAPMSADQRSPDFVDPFKSREDKEPSPPAKTAILRLGTDSGQGPAKVYVDGRYVGTTPVMRVKVVPGSHRIKFTWPDGSAWIKRVIVKDGQSKVVKSE